MAGANKARGSRTWSSPGHLSLIAFSCYAAGGRAGRRAGQARGEELSRVSQGTSHHRCGFNIYVTVDVWFSRLKIGRWGCPRNGMKLWTAVQLSEEFIRFGFRGRIENLGVKRPEQRWHLIVMNGCWMMFLKRHYVVLEKIIFIFILDIFFPP